MADTAEVEVLNERLFRTQESHERAVALRNRLAAFTVGSITTVRYGGEDERRIVMDQRAASDIVTMLEDLSDHYARWFVQR